MKRLIDENNKISKKDLYINDLFENQTNKARNRVLWLTSHVDLSEACDEKSAFREIKGLQAMPSSFIKSTGLGFDIEAESVL